MSVLIKGMEMPADCRDCPFEMYYMNCGETRCRATGKILADFYKPIPFEGRAEECPLVEMPPHGRLIDADAFLETLNPIKFEDAFLYASVDKIKTVTVKRIKDAPTVIEAEDAE